MSGRRRNVWVRRAFAKSLRARRKEARLSQEALGRRARLTGKFIGEVERGEKSVSLDSLTLIAKALGIGVVALVEPADVGRRTTSRKKVRG